VVEEGMGRLLVLGILLTEVSTSCATFSLLFCLSRFCDGYPTIDDFCFFFFSFLSALNVFFASFPSFRMSE